MPIYSYDCERCGTFSAIRSISDYDAKAECPHCGTPSGRSMAVPFLNARRLSRSPKMSCEPEPPRRKRHASSCPCCH